MDALDRLQKRNEREKAARIQAEELLEQKSRELFLANQTLKDVVKNLEAAINENTRELVNARNKAQEAEHAKSRFIANISHELLTPMNGIQGNLSLIKDSNLNEKEKTFLQRARQSSDEMLSLIQKIIEYTQLNQSKLKLNPQPFSLSSLIECLVKDYQSLVQKKKCNFCVTTSALPNTLIGDAERITEIIKSILDNAVKFTDRGKIELDVRYELPHLLIKIGDTGIGISQEDLELISQAFSKVDESHNRQHGGLGLGLSKTKQLIQAMAGTFSITSNPGLGTEVYLDIPLIPPAALEQPVDNLSVLIVDDNPVNLQIVKDLLDQRAFISDLANNGLEAFAKSQEKIYSIILMDIQMPVMDGLAATRKIRNESRMNRSTPIVAVTAHCTEDDEKSSLEAGMNAHLLKPINHYELLQTIHRFTHQSLSVDPAPNTNLNPGDLPLIEGIDANSALPRMNYNLDLFKKILLIFLSNNHNSYQELKKSIQENRMEDSILISHSLKGSAATIGANNLSKIAAIIEQQLRTGNLDQALEHMEALHTELDQVISGIKTLEATLATDALPTQVFHRDEVLKTIDSIRTHLFEDLSNTEDLINKMTSIDFPADCRPVLNAIKTEYQHFNLIQVEVLLNQLYQMIANFRERVA